MQTHSITLLVQVNFEFDPERKDFGKALPDAVDLAFNPNFHSLLNGTKITALSICDQMGSHELAHYGED